MMGKGKLKKTKSNSTEDASLDPHEPQCTCHHDAIKATDGHNVDGWTNEDIKIYNELLTERAKLEKEKNELEQKSARHQAERALLNEDAAAFDNLFKAQLSGGYKFTGKGRCCLDPATDKAQKNPSTSGSSNCHHEICTRAKSPGVSWMEMDTIKYYQARITSERSHRMKNALRKQRDVELARVKKDDEEENALRLRKSTQQDKSSIDGKGEPSSPTAGDSTTSTLSGASNSNDSKDNTLLEAAKENEMVVKRIRTRLDKIKNDIHTGRVSAFDARAKLDQANREMVEAERKNNTYREMALTTGSGQELIAANTSKLSDMISNRLALSSGDAFSQALNVMKGFFSASDPRDVQAAVTDLRSVLEVNGPMSPVLQKSFRALEDMLAKPNAKGFSVDLTNKDGTKRTCTNVVEVLLMLRNSEDAKTLEATAEELKIDKATLKANRECIKIEEQAMQDMRDALKDFDQPEDESLPRQRALLERLRELKDDAAMKSPIPPLSDIVLEDGLYRLFYFVVANALINQVRHGSSERDTSGKLTSMVIAFGNKDPEKYMNILQYITEALKTFRTDLEEVNVVKGALMSVKDSMAKFVQKHREKAAVPKVDESRMLTSSDELRTRGAASSSGGLKPEPLQVKRQERHEHSPSMPSNPSKGLDASQLASLDMTGVMKVVQNMQQQLKGLTPDDLVNMLCTSEGGKTDTQAMNLLKEDLQRFLSLPTGLEDPKLLTRIQQQIAQLASHDHIRSKKKSLPPQTQTNKPARESKFQEDLSHPPSPPPYTANEGRARSSVKVKHVPVNPPQISDAPAALSVSDQERIIAAARDLQAKTLEQKAHEMSNDLQKMRKDLLELTNLPGLSGNLAKKVRRQLDSLRQDMEKMELDEALQEEARVATEMLAFANGEVQPPPGLDIAPPQMPDLSAWESTMHAMATEYPKPTRTSKKKNNKKRTNKKQHLFQHPLPAGLPSPPPDPAPPPKPWANDTIPEAAPPSAPAEPSSTPLSERELEIQHQIFKLVRSLGELMGTPSPANDIFGFQDVFQGIVGKLEEQLEGHLEMARNVAEVNGWKGLLEWLDEVFKS